MPRKTRQQQQTTERQSNTTQLVRNSDFSKKNWLPRVGFEPTTISSPGDALIITNLATEAAQLAGLESCIQITQYLNLIHKVNSNLQQPFCSSGLLDIDSEFDSHWMFVFPALSLV